MNLIWIVRIRKALFWLKNFGNIFLHRIGSVAERSKALVLGTSLFGGVGSNPTAAIPKAIILAVFSSK